MKNFKRIHTVYHSMRNLVLTTKIKFASWAVLELSAKKVVFHVLGSWAENGQLSAYNSKTSKKNMHFWNHYNSRRLIYSRTSLTSSKNQGGKMLGHAGTPCQWSLPKANEALFKRQKISLNKWKKNIFKSDLQTSESLTIYVTLEVFFV